MSSIDLKTMLQRAEDGDVGAQVELGKLRLGQERYEDAAVWFRRAADNEDRDAQCLLGSLLSEGLGVDQDYEAAAYWLRQAAEKGHSGAQVLLAQSFESGTGVPINHRMAAQWYRSAAEQGDDMAQFRLGQLLRKGEGVEKNLAEAHEWLRKGANAGCIEAQMELVESLLETPGSDLDEVIRWGKAAAEKGAARAQYLLATALENSAQATATAGQWEALYRAAAQQGFTDAQMRLAKLYAEGKIVAKDPAEAERWLDLAIAGDKELAAVAGVPHSNPAALAVGVPSGTVRHMVAPLNEYPPGTIIENKYFIMSVLGKGGMCRVYKAKHLTMNRMVAIKMLLPELSLDAALVARFQREAQAASALSHANVVTMFDLGTTPDGKPFIVMDYLEGQSLDERLEAQGPLPLAQFVSIFMQVCSAMAAAHDASIIHRDIKPSNIMLTVNKNAVDVVKVVDFGLAKLLDGGEDSHKLTKSGEVFGTLLYMSPEQCLGHPLDPRTDIYSLGCTMYEAITGQQVFTAKTPYELMSKHINTAAEPFGAVAPHVDCPLALEAVIMKTLAKNRDERYQSVADLHDDLSKFKVKS